MVFSAPQQVTVGTFQGWQVRLLDSLTGLAVLAEGAEGVICADFAVAFEIGNEVIANAEPNSALPAAHGDLVAVRGHSDAALHDSGDVLGAVKAA